MAQKIRVYDLVFYVGWLTILQPELLSPMKYMIFPSLLQ